MAASPITIRRMTLEETDAVAQITHACAEAAQWRRQDYEVFVPLEPERKRERHWDGSGTCVLLAVVANSIAGFVVVRSAADELEILNLGVLPAHRRFGVASALLVAAFLSAGQAGARNAFCEVRESNAGARAFYAKHGFSAAGRRSAYYRDPAEDALVLARKL